MIEDPSLLEEIQPSQRVSDSLSSTHIFDDEQQQQQPLKSRFAQIKAKFEQKNVSNVMALPSSSSTTGSSSHHTPTLHRTSRKEIDDLYARHRRASNESIPNNETKVPTISSSHSTATQNSYHRSQSMGSEKSKISSFRRFNSADEADEEVSRIHRQGEELRRYNQPESSSVSTSSSTNQIPHPSHVQYEVIDEDGNPMALNDVQDLIKMSGVRAREVAQPDGSFLKEYVIDDPQLLSQFRSQQQTSATSAYVQQQSTDRSAPTPPPRVPLRPPMLFRHGRSSVNDTLSYNIQQIHVLEPQRRYEYLTTTGRRVQFFITNSDALNGQSISDADIRELANAIHLRLLPSATSSMSISSPPLPSQQQGSFTQAAFNLPKQWQPSVDLTHRQRLGSDNQPTSNGSNVGFQQAHSDLHRSASSGALNQTAYLAQNQPTNQWSTYRHPSSYSSHQQKNEPFQSSAQFLPQQQQRSQSIHSPSMHANPSSAFYQQSTTYPYQGQQQHGVRIRHDFNQQRTAIGNYGNP